MKLSANEVRVAYGSDKTSIETLYATGQGVAGERQRCGAGGQRGLHHRQRVKW